MDVDLRRHRVRDLTRRAEQFDTWADTADLMGDDAGAARFRAAASNCRLCAMRVLDD